MYKILLIDDHAVVRAGFRRLLEEQGEFEVVDEIGLCTKVMESYRQQPPDVVVVDISMPDCSGFELIDRLRAFDSSVKILVLSSYDRDPFPRRAMQAGAQGFLSKCCDPNELSEALKVIAEGGTYASQELENQLQGDDSITNEPFKNLSQREFDIFCLLAKGYTVNEVANRVHLSPKTVYVHRSNIMKKLNLSRQSELIQLAMQYKVVEVNA